MKIRYINIVLAAALSFSVTSCKKDLTDVNQNPNASQDAQPDYLLTGATKAVVDTYWGTNNNMDAALLFVQHWAKIQYTEPDH
jgi:hypothetical protein